MRYVEGWQSSSWGGDSSDGRDSGSSSDSLGSWPRWFLKRRANKRLGSLGLLGGLLLAACTSEDVDSSAIRTQGMFLEAVAVAPGDATTIVRAHLTVGGDDGTDVNLVPPDTLVAKVDEMTKSFGRTGDGRYEVVLSGDQATPIELRLERGAEDDSAGATAAMPQPFAMQLQTNADEGITRGLPIEVEWQPPGNAQTTISWSVEGDCIWSETGITPDDGNFSLNPDALRVRGTRAGEACEVALTLDRANLGDVDPQFIPGSSFQTVQRRAVRFISTPSAGEAEGEVYPDAGN